MNDQPKPTILQVKCCHGNTVDECDGTCTDDTRCNPPADQPKPTTGEWTSEMVEATLKDRPFAASTIASNHNAALAASLPDERWVTQQLQAANKLCEELQKQLAAERERKIEETWKLYKGVDPETGEMWLTLRMERDAKMIELSWEIQQLREQLEEDESVWKPLVDELTRMSFSYFATADELRQMARDAIAKVKDGK